MIYSEHNAMPGFRFYNSIESILKTPVSNYFCHILSLSFFVFRVIKLEKIKYFWKNKLNSSTSQLTAEALLGNGLNGDPDNPTSENPLSIIIIVLYKTKDSKDSISSLDEKIKKFKES